MRYESYSPSKIKWNPDIPSHWKCDKAKRFFFNPKVINKDNQEDNVLSLTLKGVIRNNQEKPIGLSPEDYSTYQIFQPNELVFKLIDLNNISTSRVGLVPETGIMSSAYIRFSPKINMNIKYFYYQYFDWYKRNIFNGLGAGVRQTISGSELGTLEILVPPNDEQDQIVRYLDWQVSKIDKLIKAKKKKIAVLKELETSIIYSVITKGTNTNISFKDSGVKWLGNIPSHWGITQIKRYSSKIGSGTTPASSNLENYEGGTISWIQSGDIYGKDIITSTEKKITDVALQNSSALKMYEAPFIVIAMYGGSVGNIAISEINACTNQACCCIKPNSEIRLKFLYYWILICKSDFLSIAEGGGQPNISQGKIKNQVLIVPPIAEQDLIVQELEQKCKQVKEQTENINSEISILSEMKFKLISDVVTGQIDVRGIEIPEYEYVEETIDDNIDDEEDTFQEVDEL